MKKLWRLLMASTVLSGLAGVASAHAANDPALPRTDDGGQASIILAQAAPPPEDDAKRKQRQEQRQERRPDGQQQQQQRGRQDGQQQQQRRQEGQQQPQQQQQQQQQQQRRQDQRPDRPAASPPPPPPPAASPPPPPPPPTTRPSLPPPPPPAARDRPATPPAGAQDQQRQRQQEGRPGRQQDGRPDRQQEGRPDRQQEGRPDRQQQGRDAQPGRDQQRRDTQQGREQQQDRQGEQDRRRQQDAGGDRRDRPVTRAGTPEPREEDAKPIEKAGRGKGAPVKSERGEEIRRVDDLRKERREEKQGNRTIIREPDRTIIREGNRTIIRHDETVRFRIGAQNVRFERRGNERITIVVRPGGYSIRNVHDTNGFLLRRVRVLPNGREIIIIDNRPRVAGFFVVLPPPRILIPRERYIVAYREAPPALIYETLTAPPVDVIERPYTLDEIRYSEPLRARMPRIDLDTVNFETGSWELPPDQIDKLAPIADAMKRAIDQNPQIVFLIEGHTDAVGDEEDNLSLSDRRAESVAVALTEEFQVPPENLTTQGYGEQHLIEQTEGPSEANRRVTVRNIAPLLAGRGDQQQPRAR